MSDDTSGPAESAAFARAIRAALGEADGGATKLERVAQTLVALAIEGNMAAIREISERLDGRASSPKARGAGDEPAEVRVKWLKD